jgi:ABC-2 type transport system ATP-binding protein
VTVLLTTHELSEAEKMADRIVILSSGRVVLEGTPQELTGATRTTGLNFGAPAGLDTSALAAALGAAARVTEGEPGRYRIMGVSGPAATAVLATWLAARNATLTDLVTGRTLEEVYLDAVGAAAPPDPVAPGAGERRWGRRGRR